ncbi:MAG: prepilin-type N-terminal cleavage/methylation domain-containing protein [Microgenomates group bacterium]
MRTKKRIFGYTCRSGFTLLELLVSAGVLSLVSVIIAQVIFTTVRLSARTEMMKEMKQNGGMAMDVVKRMIQNAKEISMVCDGAPRSVLTMTNYDGGETTISCEKDAVYADYDIFRIASYSSTLQTTTHLSSGNVTLVTTGGEASCGVADTEGASLYFTCTDDTFITVLFRLRQRNTATGIFEGEQETFQSMMIKRNR